MTPPKFYPPRPNFWFLRFVQLLSGTIARSYKMVLEIDPEDLARVKALNDDRVVLFPNHPTFREPVLVYGLSAKVSKPFYYMAAYELFNG
ncbi:MAG: 1-acyl-sn-glycerol-3-phosphate acyltransferase, partial [Synechococcales cyanobacterium RU_4_20]|nr:1-acyl-sn-glycerol-3-phosphate acyltransferase [Synechococcales cyanobacterium RU_4_20]